MWFHKHITFHRKHMYGSMYWKISKAWNVLQILTIYALKRYNTVKDGFTTSQLESNWGKFSFTEWVYFNLHTNLCLLYITIWLEFDLNLHVWQVNLPWLGSSAVVGKLFQVKIRYNILSSPWHARPFKKTYLKNK